jgi:two-component system chemotaxis response regulator CheB
LEVDRAILALEAGAFDFVLKPDRRTRGDAVASLRRLLLPKIRCFSIRRYSQAAKAGTQPGPASAAVSVRPEDLLPRTARRLAAGRLPAIEVVVVGASTGGPEALSKLIPALPRDFPLPVLTVLHMPKLFTARMAAALAKESAIPVSEACDGETAAAGHAYLAAGGMHLKVERGTRRRTVLRLTDDPPENGCKPAVDVLFRSAAAAFGERVLAVLLTGMGEDGTRGLAELKRLRAPAIVQDEATSVIWGMPGSAVKAGLADEVLPLARIAPRIVELITRNLVPE